MATLISPGVSVSIIDESYFIPASATTVPMIFIATAAEKRQQNGVDDALGTFEHSTVRTITSLEQSVSTFGVPFFKKDINGNSYHGDARNEYGLYALNQFLGIGNLAYVMRANVNLNDDPDSISALWQAKISQATDPVGAAYDLESDINIYIAEFNASNGLISSSVAQQVVNVGGTRLGSDATGLANDATVFTANVTVNGVVNAVSVVGSAAQTYTSLIAEINADLTDAQAYVENGNVVIKITANGNSQGISIADVDLFSSLIEYVEIQSATPGYKTTVTSGEFLTLAVKSLDDTFGITSNGIDTFWEESTFSSSRANFIDDLSSAPLVVYGNGFDMPSTGTFEGVEGIANAWVTNSSGSVVVGEFTATEARDAVIEAGDDYELTIEFLNQTALGATDADRRAAIASALASIINTNQQIRSSKYEFNLILAPGYPEVADEMVALAADINDEALVLGDTPMNLDPDATVEWADTPVLPAPRQVSTSIAYYYPAGYGTNLDGSEVVCAASGVALRVMTASDNASEIWFAPAGVRRGGVTGISAVGYVSGTLGQPTTFVQLFLNDGQQGNLYKYTTNINPIVHFADRGILVWGQKTSAPAASARDSINIERTIMHIRRRLRKDTLPFVFQPNDQITRDDAKATVEAFLGDILIRRGLYDYAVRCDDVNNTPTRIDRKELWIDVAVKPVKAVEFVYIPIRVLNTGDDL